MSGKETLFMLVLSRRPQEKIVFPQLGIEVEVLNVSGNTVRVGVNAPREVLVLRNEVAEKDAAGAGPLNGKTRPRPSAGKIPVPAPAPAPATARPANSAPAVAAQPAEAVALSRKWVHQLRNHLNTAGLAIQIAQTEIAAGDLNDANAKLKLAMSQLNALEAAIASGPASNGEASKNNADSNTPVVRAESLPRQIVQDPLNAPIQTEQPASLRRKPVALVVEDNENESALLAGVLRSNGFRVETASDGCHALDYLATHKRPDVVLLDMRMPRCDGPTTISAIRSNPQLNGLHVVAVSGSRSTEMGVSTGPQGVNRWFCKPLDSSRLVHELKHDLHVTTGAARPGKDKAC
jgi:carbon storage regulator CsrA